VVNAIQNLRDIPQLVYLLRRVSQKAAQNLLGMLTRQRRRGETLPELWRGGRELDGVADELNLTLRVCSTPMTISRASAWGWLKASSMVFTGEQGIS